MFIDSEEVKALTTFEEVAGLSSEMIQGYIMRADSWIRRATNRTDLHMTNDTVIQQDLKVASLLLIEYIWYWDQPETKEQAISHSDQVRLGSFSFNKEKVTPGERTGNEELDHILESLRFHPAIGNIFRVTRKDHL